jgi:NAD(P)-dependent dehydrogenase (short-subunit alcohol dehydrogenase family)
MADAAMDELAGLRETDREGAYTLATGPVPARRPGDVDEVAGLVAWLVGPQSTYVNGAVITADGGSAVVDAASLAFGP